MHTVESPHNIELLNTQALAQKWCQTDTVCATYQEVNSLTGAGEICKHCDTMVKDERIC